MIKKNLRKHTLKTEDGLGDWIMCGKFLNIEPFLDTGYVWVPYISEEFFTGSVTGAVQTVGGTIDTLTGQVASRYTNTTISEDYYISIAPETSNNITSQNIHTQLTRAFDDTYYNMYVTGVTIN